MPFKQSEIDELWKHACEFYGVPPEAISAEGPPLMGYDVPVEAKARQAFEAARKARLWATK